MNNFTEEFSKKDFPLHGCHLIAASAGTGKTFNIQKIYARLILEEGLSVSEILVVTFTENSTQELRDRLQKILSDLRETLSNMIAGEAVDEKRYEQALSLITFIGKDRNSLLRARNRCDTALQDFDRATISTIHGFCQRALTGYAFELGVPFTRELGDDSSEALQKLTTMEWRRNRDAYEALGITYSELSQRVLELSQKNNYKLLIGGDEKTKFILYNAHRIVCDYKKGARTRTEMTFDDLLLAMKDSLEEGGGHSGLAELLRKESKAVLIDEFQDTDDIQYTIFKTIFFPDEETASSTYSFFVGDPKQAIYSFRGGDIYTYSKAVDEIEERRKYQLGENFRSTPALVKAVNILFKDRKDEEHTFKDSHIPYDIEIVPRSTKTPLPSDGSKPFTIYTNEEGCNLDIFSIVAQDILALLHLNETTNREDRINPKDIAILVNTNEEGRRYKEALLDLNIKAIFSGDSNIFKEPEAKTLLYTMEAVLNPQDKATIAKALALGLFCLSFDETVKILNGEEIIYNDKPITFDTIVLELLAAKDTLIKRGFIGCMTRLQSYTQVLKRFAQKPNGERAITNLLQLIELTHNEVINKNLKLEAITEWLNGCMTQSAKSPESELRLESDEDAVTITTIFKSKGLEYPVVFLPSCQNQKGRNTKAKIGFFHDNTGRNKAFEISSDTEALTISECERNAEQMRIIYVAMTRATRKCVLYATNIEKDLNNHIKLLVKRAKDDFDINPETPFSFVQATRKERPPYQQTSADTLSQPLNPPTFNLLPTIGSFTSLTPNGESSATNKDNDNTSPEDPAPTIEEPPHGVFSLFTAGAKTGSCLHELFEKIPFKANNRQRKLAVEKILKYHGIIRSNPTEGYPGRQENQVDEARVRMAIDIFDSTLELPLSDATSGDFTLKDIPAEDRLSEWEFDFATNETDAKISDICRLLETHWSADPNKTPFLKVLSGHDKAIPKGWMCGFIDLLFRHNGRYYIIDWKSNSLGQRASAFSPAGIRDEMASHFYFLQYILYTVALTAFLKKRLKEQFNYEKHFGGIFYIFLRGAVLSKDPLRSVYTDRPSEALINDLLTLFKLQ